MGSPALSKSDSTVLTNNTKVLALEISLNQSVVNFQELVSDLQQLYINSENYRVQYLTVKEKCENKICAAAEEFRKLLSIKDHIIQAVASTLTKLNETKDLNILAEAFKILFEGVAPMTPLTDTLKTDACISSNKSVSPINKNSPNKSEASVMDDISYKEESMCEIEGTPTGRTSPIIETRKTKNILGKTEVRDKKKCPDDWPTSDSKSLKLIFPTACRTPKGGGKLRQSRLNLVSVKTRTVVDLTCSPEVLGLKEEQAVQPLIKKESIEDDTILPSPTSGPTHISLFKSISKASPSKFKKPKPLSLKSRHDRQDENKDCSNNASKTVMDESINILNQFANRIRDIKKDNSLNKDSLVKKEVLTPTKKDKHTPTKEKRTPIKKEKNTPIKKEIDSENMHVLDEDATNASIAIQEFEQLEEQINMQHRKKLKIDLLGSNDTIATDKRPVKRPLAENINITNTPPKHEAESSMSILAPEPNPIAAEPVKRKLQLVEPVYKEPTVRRKAEKRNLQGWSCEECKNFYGVLYKDDPVMLARKIEECSKHRGRHNPARPKTPPNFWNPRWTVPEDTEELNRMNNGG